MITVTSTMAVTTTMETTTTFPMTVTTVRKEEEEDEVVGEDVVGVVEDAVEDVVEVEGDEKVVAEVEGLLMRRKPHLKMKRMIARRIDNAPAVDVALVGTICVNGITHSRSRIATAVATATATT